jgi:hypothetical protein
VVSIFTYLRSYENSVYFGPLKFKCLWNGIRAGQEDKNFGGRTLQQILHSSVISSPYYTVCELEKRLKEMFKLPNLGCGHLGFSHMLCKI